MTFSHVADAFVPLLGHRRSLRVARIGPHGAFLAVDDDVSDGAPAILLPKKEVPTDLSPGDDVDVFVYLDSDDRPIATLRHPLLLLGEVAFAKIADVTAVGAFVDWGLDKQLLVPHAEQTRVIRRGERHPIGLYLDRSQRLAGTMRVTEMLRERPRVEPGVWVRGEAWRSEPRIGVFVIVEKTSVALLPASEPNDLDRGDAREFRVANVLSDGKVELSLRKIVSEAMGSDGDRILAALAREPALRVGDKSSPEEIERRFGLSKKAFKRALGGLLKRGAVRIDADGFAVALRPSEGWKSEGWES